MSQEIINVHLTTVEDNDILVFDIEQESIPDKLSVNLNSDSGQADLKVVFSKLLEKMVNCKIELKLLIDDGYTKGLYKDVCSEYIKDLNREIEKVYTELEVELGVCINGEE